MTCEGICHVGIPLRCRLLESSEHRAASLNLRQLTQLGTWRINLSFQQIWKHYRTKPGVPQVVSVDFHAQPFISPMLFL